MQKGLKISGRALDESGREFDEGKEKTTAETRYFNSFHDSAG